MSDNAVKEGRSFNPLRLLPVAIFFIVAALFLFSLQTGDPSKLPSALLGKPVPPSDFPGIAEVVANGKPVPGFTSADLAKGKVTLVNFWASWCTSCVEEHPLLAELGKSAGIDIYGVAQKDDPAATRRFLGRYGNPFAALGSDASGRQSIDWGVYGMPESFVVNGEGKIVYKKVGPISPESMASEVLPAIAAAKAAAGQKAAAR